MAAVGFKIGDVIKVFGHRFATVTGIHRGGKSLAITFHDNKKATFIATNKCALA